METTKTERSVDVARLSISFPEEDFLMLKQFKQIIKIDSAIPKNDKKIIHSPEQIASYKIRQLIKLYVDKYKHLLEQP